MTKPLSYNWQYRPVASTNTPKEFETVLSLPKKAKPTGIRKNLVGQAFKPPSIDSININPAGTLDAREDKSANKLPEDHGRDQIRIHMINQLRPKISRAKLTGPLRGRLNGMIAKLQAIVDSKDTVTESQLAEARRIEALEIEERFRR